MSDKRSKQGGKRSDKDRCRSAATKEGLRKLQELVSQTEAVVNRLADLDDDLVSKATAIVSVTRQRGRNGGKPTGSGSKFSRSSKETLPKESNGEVSCKPTIPDRVNSPRVKGDKSPTKLQDKELSHKNVISSPSLKKTGDKAESKTDIRQPQPKLQEQTPVANDVDKSTTSLATGSILDVGQPVAKTQENRPNTPVSIPDVSKSQENGQNTEKEALPTTSSTVSDDEKTDKGVSDFTGNQQGNVTPAPGDQTQVTTGDISPDSDLGHRSPSSSGTPASSPTKSTVTGDEQEEITAHTQQSSSVLIKEDCQQDVDDKRVQQNPVEIKPATEQKADTGKEQGTDTGKEEGTDTGNEQGTYTGKEQGTDTGKEQGTDTEKEQGTDTGKEQGTDTGKEQGTDTGKEQGTDAEKEEGTYTGKEQGTDTGKEEEFPVTPESQSDSSTETDQGSPLPDVSSNHPLPTAPTNEQPTSINTLTTKQQQSTKTPTNQLQPTRTPTNQQPPSKTVPNANQQPPPKLPANKQSAPANTSTTSRQPTKMQTSSHSQAIKQHGTTTKKTSSSTDTLTTNQNLSSKKLTKKPSASIEATSTYQQLSAKNPAKKQSAPDTQTTNQQLSSKIKSEDVLTNKNTASMSTAVRSTKRSSFSLVSEQPPPQSKTPSPMPSDQLSPPISPMNHESPYTTPSNQQSLSPIPSNQETSPIHVTTNQRPASRSPDVQLRSNHQSDANITPVSRPSTRSRDLPKPMTDPHQEPTMTIKDAPDGIKQKSAESQASPISQREKAKAKAKDDVRKKLQGKLRQRRGQRV